MSDVKILKFLIVDDEEDIREILSLQLQKLRFTIAGVEYSAEIQFADNGRTGFAKIESEWFDVVLTDFSMPEMDGIEMLAAIRGAGIEIPVVFLSGFGERARSAEALRLGTYAFLGKPWKSDHLRTVMQGAAKQGLAMRSFAAQVSENIEKMGSLPLQRKKQLRNVFRSIFVGRDGLHRSDVCEINSRKKSA